MQNRYLLSEEEWEWILWFRSLDPFQQENIRQIIKQLRRLSAETEEEKNKAF